MHTITMWQDSVEFSSNYIHITLLKCEWSEDLSFTEKPIHLDTCTCVYDLYSEWIKKQQLKQ